MDMMSKPGMGEEAPEGEMGMKSGMKAKMAQAMKLLQECMEMDGDDERLSVEQAFGQGFRGDSVDKSY